MRLHGLLQRYFYFYSSTSYIILTNIFLSWLNLYIEESIVYQQDGFQSKRLTTDQISFHSSDTEK
jgi:hypothetical protein